MIKLMLVAPKFLLFFLYIIFGIILGLVLSLVFGKSWYTHPVGRYIKVMWTKGVAFILGLKIKHHGKPCHEPKLIVSNHISWLDIVVIGTTQPCVFIAKNSVTRWPVIGLLAQISGTIFLDRQNRKDLSKVMRNGKAAIDAGISLVFFPEATTTNGKQLKPFHPSIYQTAIDTNCATQAIAISYPVNNNKNKISPAPYIDKDNFISHLIRTLSAPGVDVCLQYCTPIPTTYNHDRKNLALSTHNQIIKALSL